MAFSPIASAIAAGDSGTATTSGIDTSGADLIVVSVAWYAGVGNPTLSDSKGNTWTALSVSPGGEYKQQLYYCVSPTSGSGHTFTAALAVTFPVVGAWAFSGVDTGDAFDQETSPGGSTGGTTSVQAGSLTPDEDNCLVVTGLCTDPGSSHTIDGGFTEISVNGAGGVNVGGAIGYLIQTTAAAANPTWSWTTSASSRTMSAVFHAGAGGGGGGGQPAVKRFGGVRFGPGFCQTVAGVRGW